MAFLSIALIIDWWVGDPDWLWRRVKHPVVLFGSVIDWFDRKCDAYRHENALESHRSTLIWHGVALIIALFFIATLVSALIYTITLLIWPVGAFLEVMIVAIFIAQRSLRDHVTRVIDAIRSDGVTGGRDAVAMIVGRDVSSLDESGISKAAIESLAENFSDGVVAPVFWYAVGGLPGIIFYKAVNTADSMIGHRNDRYEFFGKPAALLDDLLNWIPARLSLLLIVLVTLPGSGVSKALAVWTTAWRDAPAHRSPNAGWPEAGFAAALDLQLGGARSYGTNDVDGVVLNSAGRAEASAGDIESALALFRWICLLLLVLVSLFVLIPAWV